MNVFTMAKPLVQVSHLSKETPFSVAGILNGLIELAKHLSFSMFKDSLSNCIVACAPLSKMVSPIFTKAAFPPMVPEPWWLTAWWHCISPPGQFHVLPASARIATQSIWKE